MKRVLLDENMDRKLKRWFDPEHEVITVSEYGWSGFRNGDLLRAAEAEFDILVTLDRSMQHQQHLPKYDIAVILVTSLSSRRADIEPLMGGVNRAVREASPRTLFTVSE